MQTPSITSVSTAELNLMKWAVEGLLGVVIGLIAWSLSRELRRVDNERKVDTKALHDRIELEVKHRDNTISGMDADLLGVRSKVHELGNQVSGHNSIIEGLGDNFKSMEASTNNLASVVTELRVVVAGLQAIIVGNDRRSHERRSD